jgi:hypothetical protein
MSLAGIPFTREKKGPHASKEFIADDYTEEDFEKDEEDEDDKGEEEEKDDQGGGAVQEAAAGHVAKPLVIQACQQLCQTYFASNLKLYLS